MLPSWLCSTLHSGCFSPCPRSIFSVVFFGQNNLIAGLVDTMQLLININCWPTSCAVVGLFMYFSIMLVEMWFSSICSWLLAFALLKIFPVVIPCFSLTNFKCLCQLRVTHSVSMTYSFCCCSVCMKSLSDKDFDFYKAEIYFYRCIAVHQVVFSLIDIVLSTALISVQNFTLIHIIPVLKELWEILILAYVVNPNVRLRKCLLLIPKTW